MKIKKSNLLHWGYLIVSAGMILLSLIFRPLRHFRKKPLVILYGHKLNGNIKAFYDFYIEGEDKPFDIAFLTLDKKYYRELKGKKVSVLLAYNIFQTLKAGQAAAMITSHGDHTFFIYKRLTSMKFIDVRHGIPYKGYTRANFKRKHSYDQEWLSSEYFKKLYIKEYGFKVEQIKVTGFARTDRLVKGEFSRKAILKKHDLKARKNVLLAPTWAQDDKGRSIVPFGVSLEIFLERLEEVGRRTDTNIIFRAHLNSSEKIDPKNYDYVKIMPYSKYPFGEEFLFIADILVTDWSSIAIDYLALKRPAIFLDVPAPFSKGFTLGPEHRYGETVKSLDGLTTRIEEYLKHPEIFLKKYEKNIKHTISVAYGNTLDGKANERYLQNLKYLLQPD